MFFVIKRHEVIKVILSLIFDLSERSSEIRIILAGYLRATCVVRFGFSDIVRLPIDFGGKLQGKICW